VLSINYWYRGYIDTIAGSATDGYSGDGGQATSAAMSSPRGIALDASGISLQSYLYSLSLYSHIVFPVTCRQRIHP
jgi:hypothetical protein